jgi:hypothetical protein
MNHRLTPIFLPALFAAACGGPLTYTLHGSAFAPEADAKVVAEVHKDGDFTTLRVDVSNLAPPDRLSGSTVYVVWTKSSGKWHRVGALNYTESSRKGHIEGASVPVTSFDFQLTAEKGPAPEIPSDTVVLAQHVN